MEHTDTVKQQQQQRQPNLQSIIRWTFQEGLCVEKDCLEKD